MPTSAVRAWLPFACLAIAVQSAPTTTSAQQPPPLVVETPSLPPEEQRTKFHLPPGFEIQLVVSEPDIGQPMNMNFDARGRLWVTSSVEYPYPVAGEHVQPREEKWGKPEDRPARDWVTVLEGISDDGKPAKITRFAEGLNIPIGIIPDGDGAIIYSIPNIERFRDTDGDGRADERTKLYGPFGNLDTHGMVNSFTRGLDGWIYACHGFRNTSKVQGTDGHVIEMNSGNTFRFKPDGSRIEHWTHGQVNPFGLCFDPWGNLYSADCHSKPLTCLLRGAFYQSFGKPHDGLGFGPDMIDHNHGSTGICGCAWYEAPQFPPEYRGCIFLCNPVTGRVHRDRIDFRGSSPWAVTQPDFITCDDGWFRPVDVKLGPDGALYIADFHNAVIGHYEVPLDHPRRDRTTGRIWRVVWRGETRAESQESRASPSPATAVAGSAPAQFDLTNLDDAQLQLQLVDSNIVVRRLAIEEFFNRDADGSQTVELARKVLSFRPAIFDGTQDLTASALWLLQRKRKLLTENGFALGWAALDRSDERAAVHWMHALREEQGWTREVYRAIDSCRRRARDLPHVRRAAIEAIAEHPYAGSVQDEQPLDLMTWRAWGRADDPMLAHSTKLAFRNHLAIPENADYLVKTVVPIAVVAKTNPWAELAFGLHDESGARILFASLPGFDDPGLRNSALRHIARFGDDVLLAKLTSGLAPPSALEGAGSEVDDLHSIQRGLVERGGDYTAELQDWGRRLAAQLLDEPAAKQLGWTPIAYGPGARTDSAFATQTRHFADGQQGALLHSSFPRGETGTGILRSDAFDLPPKFSFFIAGHNGPPSKPVTPNNLVRLCDAATGQVLREALPPRNDTAQRVEWDLSDCQGRRGRVEIVDGDDGTAYAWLAVGRFSIDGLNPGEDSPQQAACELIADLKLTELEPQLTALVRTEDTPASLRNAVAGALLKLHPDARRAVLREAAASAALSPAIREACYAAVVSFADAGSISNVAESASIGQDVVALLKQILQAVPADAQRQLATLLTGDRDGTAALLDLVQQGAASPRLLQDAALVERMRPWNLPDFDARLATLTADLPDVDAELTELLAARREYVRTSSDPYDAARGQALFKQHCAACHQIGGEGAKIGPQLDGVGIRGSDRLLEDILDPNRNVDAAFRTTILVLSDGQVVSGLLRREEGAAIVLANAEGKEFTVAADDVELRKLSPLSLMPAQLAEKLPPADLHQLVQYLAEKKATGSAQTGSSQSGAADPQ